MARRSVVAVVLAMGAMAVPSLATAHPLGNFTINHYSGIRFAADAILIDHVIDFAEIPTFQERRAMDTDGDGEVSAPEGAAYQASACPALAADLRFLGNGQPISLTVAESGLSFREGQAALTTRLVCVYRAAVDPAVTGEVIYTFQDDAYAERRGWREIVIEGDGMTITQTDARTETASARLTTYPTDLLSTPLNQLSATVTVTPGGPALPPFDVPDAAPVGAAVVAPRPGPTDPAVAEPPNVAEPVPAPTSAPNAAVPGGISELGGEIGALFQTKDVTPPVLLLMLLVAAGLGALHAVSPGHGKTVMAAYLVGSRGSMRHAVGLGVTVTFSHTLGVLILGAVSLSAASVIPPERLFPVLGIVSGVIVIAIGIYLIAMRIREIRARRADARAAELAHAAAHAHGDAHEHDHSADHVLDHGHDQASEHTHEDDGWHSHGGRRHTHLPPKGGSLSWRGLFALGLAGGIVPSVSAIILLLGSVAAGRPALGILLVIAFGLGMAVVLVGVGLGLVYARGFMERLPRRTFGARLSRLMPMTTAVVVLGAGLLITVQAASTL
ncbi:MAG: hypothetical protein ABIZ34_06770 [Candidatus Limnocylindrales bacterium]